MAEVKTIKDIDEETWAEFKSLAAKNKLKLGIFFKMILKEYEKNNRDFWDRILNGEKILSDEEAEDMEKIVKKIRNERDWRR